VIQVNITWPRHALTKNVYPYVTAQGDYQDSEVTAIANKQAVVSAMKVSYMILALTVFETVPLQGQCISLYKDRAFCDDMCIDKEEET
jgi:hypothetical protein